MKNENIPEREEQQNSEALAENENKETAADPAAEHTDSAQAAPQEETVETAAAEEVLSPDEHSKGSASVEDGTKNSKPKKEKGKKDTRKLRYGGMATALTAVVIVVVVLVNVVANILSDRFPLNLDLTADKLFTLSEESKTVAKEIDKEVEVIVFMEESMLENSSTDGTGAILKQLYEALKLYDSYSGGKVKTSYVDLNSDPALYTKYKEYNVEYYDLLFLCGDRHQKISANDMFTYDDSSYYYTGQISVQSSKVEQMLASSLMMVTSDVTPEVLFLTGHEEDSYTVAGLKAILEVNNYSPTDLNITGSEEYSDEAVMAVIAAPTKDYSDEEIEALREWLDNDGKQGRQLMVIVNYTADCPKLYEFLNVEYGLEVTDNLIEETDPNRVMSYQAFYTYADIGDSDYLSDLSGKLALAPMSRQILANAGTNTDASLFNTALLTFPESAKLVKMADAIKDSDDKDQETPEPFDADEYPIIGGAMATKWTYDDDNNRIETNVIVLGSNAMVYDNFTSMSTVYNEEFLLNIANGVTGNETPVNISNKPLEQTTLEFTSGQANIFFVVFVVAVPVIILIACLVVFLRRRRL